MKYTHDRFVKIPLSTMLMVIPALKGEIERMQKWLNETNDSFNKHTIELVATMCQSVIDEVERVRNGKAVTTNDQVEEV